ncbi:serine-threonine/tyrosine-protein kinase catalytic domain-containing protein [Artemisia annua]|uniref:Serine-threonine/tyrosine-protein kinase catalytic domain-containing protein n=1 Tax=Artemisia annua TaxID=35608 RepID=A0A2U1NYL8_ARTAN|nr:serine-threonine/tyrosine-protein kinase catalytic domain-containing protein [Artemisia annua]
MLPLTTKENEPSSSYLATDQICQQFTLDVIRLATLNFSEGMVIGRGGFGKVYKGHFDPRSDVAVAIKRLHSMSNQGAPEFRAELEMLSKLRHCNLVSLIGFCSEGTEMALVYDYMPHGTLEDHLYKSTGNSLNWLQRLKICIGAARGLEYLHTGTGTQHGIIHRDVKSSNILLDGNFAAKISDFGLAKIGPINQTCTYVSTGVKGTFGYMDPCYFYTGKLTRKSDVYSFGVVLLEVMCGRPAVDSSLEEEQCGLAMWAQSCIKEGKLTRIIDSRLKGQVSSNSLKKFAHIACRCLDNRPNQRPTMAEIIARLELILSLQERLESSVTDKLWSLITAKGKPKANKKISEAQNLDNGMVPTKLPAVDRDYNKVIDNGMVTTKSAAVLDLNYNEVIHFDDSLFTAEELLRAQAEVICTTSYGRLFLATMKSGKQVTVRRMIMDSLVEKDHFIQGKMYALGKLRHANILRFIAYFNDSYGLIFIRDHIKNGSVASFLQSTERQGSKPVNYLIRMRMIAGITRGLVYLHTQENMVHGYLTSENVMLEDNYNPLIADVGVSMLTKDIPIPSQFRQNHAPELLKLEQANKKSDIYSLGYIMLELLTKKSTDSKANEKNLVAWVKSVPREDLIAKVVNQGLLLEEFNLNQELVRLVELAMVCVSESPNSRPNADQVLQQLDAILRSDPSVAREASDGVLAMPDKLFCVSAS